MWHADSRKGETPVFVNKRGPNAPMREKEQLAGEKKKEKANWVARAPCTCRFEKREDPPLTLVSERGPCVPVRKGNNQEEGKKKPPLTTAGGGRRVGEKWQMRQSSTQVSDVALLGKFSCTDSQSLTKLLKLSLTSPLPFFCDTMPPPPFCTTLWNVPSPPHCSGTCLPPCLALGRAFALGCTTLFFFLSRSPLTL